MKMEPPMRYTGYIPELSSRPLMNHENGRLEFPENGFRDIGLVTPGPSMFEVVERAELALRRKTFEADQLRSQLLESRQEIELLKNEMERTEAVNDRSQDRSPDNAQKDVPIVQNSTGLASQGSRPHLSPPRAASPNRQPEFDANGKGQNMLLTSSQHEDEISQLRARILEAGLKETQLIREIRSLEWRLSELRVAYDQQQQNLAEAASKALSYRQELVDDNVKIAYDLQVLEQERSVYVSSLLPLLSEFGMEPPSTDAQSIVSCVKGLLQHLNNRANEKRINPGFHRPWQITPSSPPNIPQPQSPTSNGRELVPRPCSPINLGIMGNSRPAENSHNDIDLRSRLSPRHNNLELVRSDGYYEDVEPTAALPERVEVGRRSPVLPSLPEEPNLAPSEADEEALPAVAGLRIVGDAVLGGKLTVCGHSINGTALCNFQWNRYYPDGDIMEDIAGASRTEYTVSADDVDTFIAIQCCPMDDRGRQGIQVTEFANGQNPIKCDPTMEDQINSHLVASHALFEVQVLLETSDQDQWENGTLILKRGTYEIRRNNVRLIREPYTENVNVRVVLGRSVANQFVSGQHKQCAVTTGEGALYFLAFQDNRVRDCAVLTLRRFRHEALKSKKGKKGWFKKSG